MSWQYFVTRYSENEILNEVGNDCAMYLLKQLSVSTYYMNCRLSKFINPAAKPHGHGRVV